MIDYENLKQYQRDQVQLLDLPSPSDGEIVAVAMPIYESVKRAAVYSFSSMMMNMARTIPEGNLWNLRPKNERMGWPYSDYWYIMSMLEQERQAGRKADWLLYLEDDVIVPQNLFSLLREAADPVDRPIMSTVGYSRDDPYWPGVLELDENGVEYQWRVAPEDGVREVSGAPFCAILIHRRIFDVVPEPWFNLMPMATNSRYACGPDRWFFQQCAKAGIYPHVRCDVNIEHILPPVTMDRRKSEAWQDRYRAPVVTVGGQVKGEAK